MKKYGIISYNLYCNFTNYGSALQQYALHRVVNELAPDKIHSVVMDYCPDCLSNINVLNPFGKLWDKDEESKRMVELTLPAIRTNWEKFQKFFKQQYDLSKHKYTTMTIGKSLSDENLDGYICGSDTIWCPDEFSLDDGYYANIPEMKNSHTISYAASMGDPNFSDETYEQFKLNMNNYKAIGVRETTNLNIIKKLRPDIAVEKVIDPTFLLKGEDYKCITAEPQLNEPYILLYARRYNPKMEEYAEKLATKYRCKIVDISLRAVNADKGHIMRYDAGVEEFLALVKNAKYVVTNSYHGAIFAVQMHSDFVLFSREQCNTKIDEMLAWIGLSDRKVVTGEEEVAEHIDYIAVEEKIAVHRKDGIAYLKNALLN